MTSFVARRALSTSFRRLQAQAQPKGEHVLKSESKRNPELLVRHILFRKPLFQQGELFEEERIEKTVGLIQGWQR